MLLGAVGIIYGAVQAFSQTDLKRLVAYTSVSHMGFVMLGVFAFTEMALQGVVMQMITHAISTGALFVLAGALYERIHTRDILQMGGFWKRTPFMATVSLIFVMASLGLPGLGNFIAEFLTLLGSWSASPVLTAIATAGLVAATAYSLRIMQKIFLGKDVHTHALPDLSLREKLVLVPMAIAIIVLGLFPQRILDTAQPTLGKSDKQKTTTPVPTRGMLSVKGGNHE
jgi:NADH-quinone oxidoreductase subunit M